MCTPVQGVAAFILRCACGSGDSSGCGQCHLDMYTCSRCYYFHPNLVPVDQVSQSVQIVTTFILIFIPVQDMTSFILTHIPVVQVDHFRMWAISSWHIAVDQASQSGQGIFTFILTHNCGTGESVQNVTTLVLRNIPGIRQVHQFRLCSSLSEHLTRIRWADHFKVCLPPSWHTYLWIILIDWFRILLLSSLTQITVDHVGYEEKASNCCWGRHVRKRTWKMYSPMDGKRWEK